MVKLEIKLWYLGIYKEVLDHVYYNGYTNVLEIVG